MLMIAEIGINHNGNLDNALKLIDVAKHNNCDIVKFQKRNPDLCVPEDQKNKEKIFMGQKMTYLEYKHQIEFGKKEFDTINEYCKKKNIQWTASVWDIDSVKFMEQYKDNIPFLKIPSACITDIDLLKAINQTDIPVVFSNGMSTQKEVDAALSILNNVYGIMHCNSSYPCAWNEIDLNVMLDYKNRYPHLKIGYSGHEEGLFPTVMAIILGADLIERHITLSNDMEGSDHKASLDPTHLDRLMWRLNSIKDILGSSTLKVYPKEEEAKQKLRKV